MNYLIIKKTALGYVTTNLFFERKEDAMQIVSELRLIKCNKDYEMLTL